MRKFFITAVSAGLSMLFSSVAGAGLITIVSGSSTTDSCQLLSIGGNAAGTLGGCTEITAHSAWQQANPFGNDAEWISYANTGIGGFTASPDTIAEPRMAVIETFTVGAGQTEHLYLTVWADDTAEVFIDGVSLNDPNFTQDVCAAGPLSCEPDEGVLFDMWFGEGEHTILIEAYQGGGGPFGVLYSGVLTVSEPGLLGFLGLGLLGMGVARRRRG